MKRYKCEMCGKKVLQVHDHHVIPWWFSQDDSESNIMRLCPSCHKKADSSFDNLILRGKMNVVHDTHKRATARYNKKYMTHKMLFHMILLKRTYYYDMLFYNIKTGNIRVMQWWQYVPNMHICSNVNSRKRLVKAAVLKGQTTLGGRS